MLTRAVAALLLAASVVTPVGAAQEQARNAPVGVGEVAPDFTLEDQNGKKHSLSAERGKRPVVLIFYRGYW